MQRRAALFVTDKIHEISDLPLKIGAVRVRHFNKIEINDILLNDLGGDTLASAKRLTVHMSIWNLLQNKVEINTISLARPSVRITKATPESESNMAFLVAMLAGNDSTPAATIPDIRINQLQIYDGKFSYDILSEPSNGNQLCSSHIRLSDIQTNISLKKLNSDTLNLYIRNITCKERSGLQIKHLRTRLQASKEKLQLEKFRLLMPDSEIISDKISAKFRINNGTIEELEYEGKINSDGISLHDLSSLLPIPVAPLPKIKFAAAFKKKDEKTEITRLRLTTDNNSINIGGKGFIAGNEKEKPNYEAEITDARITQEGLESISLFAPQNIRTANIDKKIREATFTGKIESTNGRQTGTVDAWTRCGTLLADWTMDPTGDFTTNITARLIELGIITEYDNLGMCHIFSQASGNYQSIDSFDVAFNTSIASFTYNDYEYDIIEFEGKGSSNTLTTDIKIKDRNIAANARVDYDNRRGTPHYRAKADIDYIKPWRLNLADKEKQQTIAFNIDAEFTGRSIDDATFSADLYDLRLTTPEKEQKIHRFNLRDNKINDKRSLIIDSDIINGYLMGHYRYTTLPNSLHRILQEYLPSLSNGRYNTVENNKFVFSFDIANTEILNDLFDIPVTIKKSAKITGNCDDSRSHMTLNALLHDATLSNRRYRSINIAGASDEQNITCDATFVRPIATEDNADFDDTSNDLTLSILSTIGNDTLRNRFEWSNMHKPVNKGSVRCDIAIGKEDGRTAFSATMLPSMVIYSDEAWTIAESNIYSKADKYHIENFILHNKDRELSVNGIIGGDDSDSLHINMKQIDLEQLFDIANFHPVEFGGIATGEINVARLLDSPKFDSRLKIDNFRFEKGYLGEMDFSGVWNEEQKAIIMNADIVDGKEANTKVSGFVSPANDSINLMVNAHNTRIDFLNHLVPSVMSDVEGRTSGRLNIRGGLKKINLYGAIAMNGRMRLRPNNVTYNFTGDTVRFVYNKIALDRFNIKDIHGNNGFVSGGVHHNCLKHFTCDFKVDADNLLAYYSPDFGNETFYGTAFVSGDASISVDDNGTFLHANVQASNNSKFVYNAAGSAGASSNEFVTFTDREQSHKKTKKQTEQPAISTAGNVASRLRLDFMIDVTPGLQLRVYTNTATDDYIDLYGNGPVNAVYDEKEGFSMKGNMSLTRGTYKFTLQDIFPKVFNIQSGSTLDFNGDPFQANLNLNTVYTVPSASLADLDITADKRQSVRVNCLMNITGTLASPNLTFGLELPDGNEEERELLSSATSTQEQINMQFIYLLGIGKFYTYDYNNQENENQSSTMMESLISSTISGQLNNMLSRMTDNDNWNIQGNFTTNERGWNSMEVEGILQGRLLDNRLLINGNFGYRDNPIANKNFIGDFEVQWLLNKSGNVSLKAYNKTNDRYFSETTLTTQGAGILLRHDFDSWKFWKKQK